MKKITTVIATAFLTICFATSCSIFQPLASPQEAKIEVNDAFKKVYEATQQALAEKPDPTLKLASIDLTFATTVSTSGDAGIKLWVVSGKYSKTKSNTKQATFSFKEDTDAGHALVSDPNIEQFKKYLIAVIQSTQDIKSIEKFGLKEIEVQVDFLLKNSIEGGVEIEIVPVTPSLSVNREKEVIHSITLTFEKNVS